MNVFYTPERVAGMNEEEKKRRADLVRTSNVLTFEEKTCVKP